MQLIERAGLWQTFVGFQQEVVEMTAEVLGSSGSVYGVDHRPALVSQAIFAGNPPFRDGIHMTEQASREVARCLRGLPGCNPKFAPERLTPSTIDEYLERLTSVKDDYRHTQPDDYRYLRQLEEGLNLD
jgi:hypothetical protein